MENQQFQQSVIVSGIGEIRCSGARTSFTSFEKVHTHTRHCRAFTFLSAIKLTKTNQSCGSVFPESEILEGVVLEVEYHEVFIRARLRWDKGNVKLVP